MLASSSLDNVKHTVMVDVRKNKSMECTKNLICLVHTESLLCMTPIVNFKLMGKILIDVVATKVIKRIALKFCIIDNELFKKSYVGHCCGA